MDRAVDADLASQLEALASPTRLALLRTLRHPQILAEIDVRSGEREGAGAPLARQSVRKHLDMLLAAGVIASHDVVRDRRDTVEFVLNHQAIYAIAEEVRDLARLRPAVEVGELTTPRGAPRSASQMERPSLVVVKGLDEGTGFHLAPDPPRRTSWILGRRRGCDVALDFDPFVSAENSLITWSNGAHWIETLPNSRNGTSVNFQALAHGASRKLAHGDIVSVGRSALAYWA